MNNYYHEISFSFNWWMLVALGSFVIMFILGERQYMLKNLKFKRRYSEGVFGIVAMLLAVITGVMFIMESSVGLLQFVINHFDWKDSLLYAYIVAAVILLVTITMYGFMLYFTSTVAVVYKKGKLREERNRIIRKRQRRERRMSEDDDGMDPWA